MTGTGKVLSVYYNTQRTTVGFAQTRGRVPLLMVVVLLLSSSPCAPSFNERLTMVRSLQSKLKSLRSTETAVAALLADPLTAGRTPLSSPFLAEQWNFTLHHHQLLSSTLFVGHTARLKQVLLRLLRGEEVRVGAVGGSVTVGHSAAPGLGYYDLVVGWMKKAFPKATIHSRNGGTAGMGSFFMELCGGNHVDPDVDLMIVEYAMNDAGNRHVPNYERLLRSLLTRQLSLNKSMAARHNSEGGGKSKPPALLLLDLWRCCPIGNDTTLVHFTTNSADTRHQELAQYYHLPLVSLRNALYHSFRVKSAGFERLEDWFIPFFGSWAHPSTRGHRLVADIVIHALYTALGQLEQHGGRDAAGRVLAGHAKPRPHNTAPLNPALDVAGITQGDVTMLEEDDLPPLVFSQQEAHTNIFCLAPDDLSKIVVKKHGFSYTDEGRGKWGFLAKMADMTMELELDASLPPALLPPQTSNASSTSSGGGTRSANSTSGPHRHKTPGVHVNLGLLHSYQHMGIVNVACVKGCACKPHTFNTHLPSEHSSQVMFFGVPLTKPSAKCRVRLVVSNTTTSGEHRIKLSHVSVSAEVC